MIRRPAIISTLGLGVTGIGLAALLIEGGLRAMPQYLPMGARLALDISQMRIAEDIAREDDLELGFKVKPNADVLVEGHPEYRYHIRTYLNFPDAGFRGNVVARPLVGIALGDSFTFGQGVEAQEAWPEQLSSLAGRNFANLGVFNYGPPQYTGVLQRYGLSLRPKIVLYAIYLHNDLWDAAHFVQWQQEGGPYTKRSFGQSRFLARHSRLYQLLLASKEGPGLRAVVADRKKLLIQVIAEQPAQQQKIAWDSFRQAILSARHLVQDEGATLVVLLVPSKAQTYRRLLRTSSEPQEVLDLDERNREMLRLCTAYQIRCLDLAPRFQEGAQAGEQLYFRIDGHWNAAGHRLAARAIYDYLIDNHLLEETRRSRRVGGA